MIRHSLIALGLASTAALAQAPSQPAAWTSSAGVSHLCGGVGSESFEGIEAQRDLASLVVLLTAGERGEYLADVALTVDGEGLAAPIVISSDGPLCLFQLPPGRYTVSARHADQTREAVAKTGTTPVEVQLRFAR